LAGPAAGSRELFSTRGFNGLRGRLNLITLVVTPVIVLRVFSTDEQARISFTEAPRRPIYGSEESFANLADPAAAM
jgi:hypothetical protein